MRRRRSTTHPGRTVARPIERPEDEPSQRRLIAVMAVIVLVAIGLAAAPAFAEPDTAAAFKKETARLRGECDKGTAASCARLGSLLASEYESMATGYHHKREIEAARKADQKAIDLWEPACTKGDGDACNEIASVYNGEAFDNREKGKLYLEKACAANHAWSCFDRGQWNGRSKSSTVPWYAKACTLGNKDGCGGLGMMVIASFVLDPVDKTPMDATELRAALTTAATGATEQHARQLELASAAAHVWAGERKEALAELAKVKPTDKQLQLFHAFIEIAAADGIDKARVQAAAKRLDALTEKHSDGSLREMELESDYAWADATKPLAHVAEIVARNR